MNQLLREAETKIVQLHSDGSVTALVLGDCLFSASRPLCKLAVLYLCFIKYLYVIPINIFALISAFCCCFLF